MKIGRLAPAYRWIEYAAFGKALERRRFALLNYLSEARRVLILGEGDGRALERLLRIAPQAHFDVVECSAEMIALARKRIGKTERVRYLCQDAASTRRPSDLYDGLVTFFFLDCFDQDVARLLISRLERYLAPGGIWLVSDFAIPDDGWRRWHARIWIRTMYCFFRMTTGLRTRALPPMEHLLREVGMRRIQRQQERAGMMFSEAWVHRIPSKNEYAIADP